MDNVIDFAAAKAAREEQDDNWVSPEIAALIEELENELNDRVHTETIDDHDIYIGNNGVWVEDDEMSHCLSWNDLIEMFKSEKQRLLAMIEESDDE